LLIIVIFVFYNQGCIRQISTDISNNQDTKDDLAYQQFFRNLSKIKRVIDSNPNDSEIQLGVFALYEQGGGISDGNSIIREQIESFAGVEPRTKACWLRLNSLLCEYYTHDRNSVLGQLKSFVEHGNKENLLIPYYCALYPFFKEGEDGVSKGCISDPNKPNSIYENCWTIKDINYAERRIREQVDKRLLLVLNVIEKGQRIDTENAAYNYLKAQIYFQLGMNENAINEVQEAIGKKYYDFYVIETVKAKSKVLSTIKFPRHFEDVILWDRIEHIDSIEYFIWMMGLEKIAKEYISRKDFEKAEGIYNLAIKIAKQMSQEKQPYRSKCKILHSILLEKKANEGIKKIKILSQQMSIE